MHLHTGDGLARLPAAVKTMPDAFFWFDNVLGQLRFTGAPLDAVGHRLQALQNTLKPVAWGSVHDRMSGRTATGSALPLAHRCAAGLAMESPEGQDWLQKIGAISPWLDHLTEQVLPLMGPGSAIASIASTGGLGWSRRIPTNMEFVTTKGYDAAVAWCEAHLEDVVKEGYSFSKENVIVWTQYMGAHLIKKGIRINCTLPSPTQTPMMATFEAASGKDVVAAAAEPMGRYSTPAEQAGGIVLLNSDLAGIVNGVVFPVDGGFMGGVATGQVDLSVMMRRSAPAEA